MHLQEASKRELKRISAGVAVGCALMLLVFFLIGKFQWSVLFGALLGGAVAVGNFLYLALSVQKAAAGDETQARLTMRSSYTVRMLVTVAAVILGVTLDCFSWVAVVIALLLPRLTILVLQITGAYRPEPPAAPDMENKEE